MIAPAVFALAQYRAGLTVADRSELRVRTSDISTITAASGAPIFDLINQPSASLALSNRKLLHTISYSPTLTLRGDALPGGNPEIFQTASVQTNWRLTRQVTFGVSESASYGSRNFADLLTPQAGTNLDGTPRPIVPLQLLPASTSVHYGTTVTTFGAVAVPARRWQIQNRVSYGLTGGTDNASQLFLPLQRRASFENATRHLVARTDALITTVTPSVVHVPQAICEVQPVPRPQVPLLCDHAFQFIDVTEGWSHGWTRHTTSIVSAGISGRRFRLGARETYRPTATPLVAVEVQHKIERVVVQITSRISPVVDQRLGTVDTRADSAVTATWKHGFHVLRGSVQYSQSIPGGDPTSIRAFRTEGVITRRFDKRFDAEAGVRTTWQEQSGSRAVFANAFVALIYHEPRLLF